MTWKWPPGLGWYKERRNVEQVFRASKGMDIMSSQLDEAEKLHKLAIMALMACVRVMQLVRAQSGQTGQSASAVFTQAEADCLEQVCPTVEGRTEKLKNPYQRGSLAFAAWVIARLAGWSGYKTHRPPGPIDFITGLNAFGNFYRAYISQGLKRCVDTLGRETDNGDRKKISICTFAKPNHSHRRYARPCVSTLVVSQKTNPYMPVLPKLAVLWAWNVAEWQMGV